jgi:hypothetical protein
VTLMCLSASVGTIAQILTGVRNTFFATLAIVKIADADVKPESTGRDANLTMKPCERQSQVGRVDVTSRACVTLNMSALTMLSEPSASISRPQ